MPKKVIRRFMPDHETIKKQKSLKIFGKLLHDPNLWCLNRRSVAGAFALGLFNAFMPVPFQMWLSAIGAIYFKVNLPLSIALVWITNPLTIPPIFYGCYLVGEAVLGSNGHEFKFEMTWQWLVESLTTIGPAFLLGCFICATFFSIIGYFLIQISWRYSIRKQWQERIDKRATVSG